MAILVTGGAGYIGSHVVRLLQEQGDDVVVLDDFSEGIRERIQNASCYNVDLANRDAVAEIESILVRHEVTAVVHLAARKKVGESVARPAWYHEQNVGGLENLLAAMKLAKVVRLVFSSTAAVYGNPDTTTVSEATECSPINPYGETKLICESLCRKAADDFGLRHVSLRYFNVAGVGAAGLQDIHAANLIPIVFQALESGKAVPIFGSDWPTPDGTCVRDYVHVSDLARAHISALNYIKDAVPEHTVFNVGTGRGSSVLDVISEVEKVTHSVIQRDFQPRRDGDPASLSADVTLIRDVLGWKAEKDLHDIVASIWNSKAK